MMYDRVEATNYAQKMSKFWVQSDKIFGMKTSLPKKFWIKKFIFGLTFAIDMDIAICWKAGKPN